MRFRIVADEDVDFRIVTALMRAGFDITSVLREHQGMSDAGVIELAKQTGSILVTEDSDFGHWVFARNERDISVIFLRYDSADYGRIAESLIRVLNDHGESLYGKFAVITCNKIRIREI